MKQYRSFRVKQRALNLLISELILVMSEVSKTPGVIHTVINKKNCYLKIKREKVHIISLEGKKPFHYSCEDAYFS